MLVNEDEALVGMTIGDRYHIRELLGQGSTGTVFGTVHASFERPSAMKVLRPRYNLPETITRIFHSETRPSLSITHPSLCEVFDIGNLPDGAPFFVMERLEGDTLASRLGRERFSTAAAVDLLMQLLSAMEAVHARELIFRDLRPQNIVLTHRRGCRPLVKVLDFGLARLIPLERIQAEWDALRSVVTVNDASGPLSIPYYLSPERARSDHGIEPASDLFVAATIFYEAVTAQKPFSASTWNGIVQAIVQARPTPISLLRPDLPDGLSALVMRTLSAHPRGRPASAREMQDELRGAFEGTRRGSASMRTMPMSVTESVVHTPPRRTERAVEVHTQMSARPTDPPTVMRPPVARDDFDDETSTDRKAVDTNALRDAVDAVDEASADHPVRTIRPPRAPISDEIDVDIPVEQEAPATSRGSELGALLGLSSRPGDEEEETETLQLTPEFRAKIEQMTGRVAPPSSPETNRPPPTRRLTKPPG
jgi:serine/threonine-protein kinase